MRRSRLSLLQMRVLMAALGFLSVIAVGTIGYAIMLDWTLLDAMYMSVITISTVGYREVYELDHIGKLFTIVLILTGVGSFTYLISTVHNLLIAGQLFGRLERRAMEKRIESINSHVIVCGYGRMGAEVVAALLKEGTPVVVVERDREKIELAHKTGAATLEGDAEEDGILAKAGVDRARALVTVVDDDASNLMVTLTARGLNPDLYIVSRINRQVSEKKLKQAGADRILWPYGLAGRRIAQLALRPGVVEFFDVVQKSDTIELKLEEAVVAPGSPLDGKRLHEAGIRERTGTTVIAVRRSDGRLESAVPETRMRSGDLLLAVGNGQQLDELRQMAGESAEAVASESRGHAVD